MLVDLDAGAAPRRARARAAGRAARSSTATATRRDRVVAAMATLADAMSRRTDAPGLVLSPTARSAAT